MDAARMAFRDDSFDTVAICNSLHHLHALKSALDEMKRVLKPGGLFIICEVVQDKKSDIPNPHTELHHWFAAVDRMNGISHNETFAWFEVTEIVKKLGLRGIEIFEFTEPADNSNHQEMIKSFADKCDIYLDRIKGDPRFAKLVNHGVQLKTAFLNGNFSWAPLLYVLGWK